jgi:hypothetical protein
MRLDEFDTDKFDDFKEMFGKFLPIAMETIELLSLPKFHFDDYVDSPNQPTFGMYKNGQNVMHVGLAGRHPVDILRTIAHELVHYKQDTEHQLNPHSGDTGSPEENQAHQLAGVVMRHFNKEYPDYLRSKPVMEGLTPDAIHDLADRKKVKWDNDPKFLSLTKRLTGKQHLDDLDEKGLRTVYDYLSNLDENVDINYGIGANPGDLFKIGDVYGEKNTKVPHAALRVNTSPARKKLLGLPENFADGKGPGRPGDSQRHGIPKKATMAELEKASHAKGRKGQLARWQLNMRRGRKK